jgi:hypothetical protein
MTIPTRADFEKLDLVSILTGFEQTCYHFSRVFWSTGTEASCGFRPLE